MDRSWLLTFLILGGMVLGLGVGQFYHDPNWHVGMEPADHAAAGALSAFDFFGSTVFMGLLKMLRSVDLRNLQRNKNIPSQLSRQARNLYRNKGKEKK